MRYSGSECAVCKTVFTENDDVVVCPVCGTPHHRECWFSTNACANTDKHAEGFEWSFPEGKDPVEILKKQAEEKKKPAAPDIGFKNGEGVKYCPKCGAINYGNDAFCMRCHAPLSEEQNGENTSGSSYGNENADRSGTGYYRTDPRKLAYDNQRLYGGLEPNILLGGIPVGELSEYIGGKTPGKMIRRFANAERFGNKFTFNLPAMLFGPVYCLFRKMYKLGAVVFAIFFALSLGSMALTATPEFIQYNKDIFAISSKIAQGEMTADEYSAALEKASEKYAEASENSSSVRLMAADILHYGTYALFIACGLLFDKYYKKKIYKDVMSARKENDNMTDYRNSLVTKGGTSAVGVILGVILFFGLSLLSELPVLIQTFFS